MASLLATASSRAAVSRPSARRGTCTMAALPAADQASRRALVGSLLFAPALIATLPAKALIPDDEDEELVAKAKAKRKQQLIDQRQTTRKFMEVEGLSDTYLKKELVPIQKAVFKLAEAGTKLEKGDARAVSSALSESWVSDFSSAARAVSSGDAATKAAESLLSGIDELKKVSGGGDAKQTKKEFVKFVGGFSDWAKKADIASSLKGL